MKNELVVNQLAKDFFDKKHVLISKYDNYQNITIYSGTRHVEINFNENNTIDIYVNCHDDYHEGKVDGLKIENIKT